MSEGRLAVSTEGMREIHAARPAWSLVKELVQNAWDEAPAATVCKVGMRYWSRKSTLLVVEDDGPGFRDIRDAYTLMGPTYKRSDPAKRGRFNIGEKELVAVAVNGKIETVGTTIEFPKKGGRVITKNHRKSGTLVELVMPWDGSERRLVLDMLRRFQPPADCRLIVNDHEVERREPVAVRQVRLSTVLQDGPGQPMRPTRRLTNIEILEPQSGWGWIHEMGIPIQQTTMAYDVDIMQKVPMPPNRDTVSEAYLRDVASEVLNATHELMAGEEFAETWVRSAIEDERIEEPAVRATIKHRYGDKVAIWSTDTDANMKAAEAGYQVLHPRSMSPEERENMKQLGGLESTMQVFGRGDVAESENVEPNESQVAWADWVRSLGEQVGLDVTVVFIKSPGASMVADCTSNRKDPVIRFNLSKLFASWLDKRGPDQLALVIHEFGHALADTPMEHGPRWGEAACKAGAMLAANHADVKL